MKLDNERRCTFTHNIHPDFHKKIEEIADELAYNYLANSFGDDVFNHTHYKDILNPNYEIKENNPENEPIGELYNKRKIDRRRCRNILIIGAGASFDSFSGVPLGQQLVNSFEDIFVSKLKSIPFLEEKYNTEKKEILKLLKGDFDFENFLSLLSSFFVTQSTLREEIKNHTGFRYSPSLFYEIVAHMLKHTFLDVVINFNFDEMLDQCIHEELGEENYHFVLSDGHTVKIEDILVEGRIKAPVYMKPHGTFSHKSSLRFTKRHYLDLPVDVQEMLRGLLSGYRGKGKEVERVNLICVGFDLASIEFNDILNENLSSSSRIYHFFYNDKNSPEMIGDIMKMRLQSQLGDFMERAVANGLAFEDIYKPINLKNYNISNDDNSINQLTTPLGELFSVLWRKTYNRFNEFNKPRSIARHEIISYLFYDKKLFTNFQSTWDKKLSDEILRSKMREYYEESPKYFRDRVMVEVALELLRNNGNVDIVEVLKGRTGLYFEKYQESCKTYSNKIRVKHTIYDFLSEFSMSGSAKENIKDEKEYPDTKLTFRILPFTKEHLLDSVVGDIKYKFKNDIVGNFRKPIDKFFAPQARTEDNEFSSISKYDIERTVRIETEEFISWVKNAIDMYYNNNPLAVSILCNLLRSDLLSSRIRENILNNYKKRVHNGLLWNSVSIMGIKDSELSQSFSESNLPMIQELFRIFTKTSASNYFNIKAKKNDSRFRIWESFQLKNVLHTNLLLSNDFKYVFLNKNWDCLLSVFETGDTIKGIIKENAGNDTFLKKIKNQKISLICSYEAVEQIHLLRNGLFRELHDEKGFYKNEYDTDGNLINKRVENNVKKLNDKEKYRLEVLIEQHKELICSDINFENCTKEKNFTEDEKKKKMEEYNTIRNLVIANLSIVFVPFWEHNQHCSVFLKSVDENNDIIENSLEGLMLIKPRLGNDIKVSNIKSGRKSNVLDNSLVNGVIDGTGKDFALSKIALVSLKNYDFLFEGGYHMYRKGFSNSLNPVRLGKKDFNIDEKYIRRDIDKLLLFYFKVLCRGIMYQVQNASQMGYHEDFIIRDLVYHRSWSAEEFYNRMQLFMSNLFTYVSAKKR
jgi:hypothetical protein